MQPFNTNCIEVHASKRIRINNRREHEILISIGNEILGYNSWSHSIVRRDIDYIDCENGRYSVGVSVVVKVELKNGVYHEELGYGTCNVCDNKGSAIALAQQDAAVEGLREALRSFGGEIAKRLSQNQNDKPLEVKVENHSPTGTVPRPPVDTSPCTEDEVKLERKRRQQQKKEEFLQQLKQKQHHVNNGISNKENGTNVGRVNSPEKEYLETLDMDDGALLSTQEMDRMVQSATSVPKSRMPLISSPSTTVIENTRSWAPIRPNKVHSTPRNMLLATKSSEGPYKSGRV